MLKTGKDPRTGLTFTPFKMQINPKMRYVPDWAYEKWPTLMRFEFAKDRFGRKIRDDNSFFQPEMSAAYFVHQVYDSRNQICTVQCKRRCMEGLGKQDHTKNKRLQGPTTYAESVS